jgi:hypothetical protein
MASEFINRTCDCNLESGSLHLLLPFNGMLPAEKTAETFEKCSELIRKESQT